MRLALLKALMKMTNYLFNWQVILVEPLAVVVLTLGLIAGKGIAITIITNIAGYSRGIAIRTGILLGQGSEFGFAVLAVAITTDLGYTI